MCTLKKNMQPKILISTELFWGRCDGPDKEGPHSVSHGVLRTNQKAAGQQEQGKLQ